jgi:hypothetical protein
VEELKARFKREEKTEHEKNHQSLGLTDIENAVQKYIKEHPGASKQAVVDYFDQKKTYTRVPLFRTISSLVQYGMVTTRKDPSNRQTYNLYVNSESLLVSLINEFEKFEIGYRNLVEETKVDFAKMASWRKSYNKKYNQQLRKGIKKEDLDDWYWETSERKIQGEEESILSDLLSVYKSFIFIHIFIALFKWPSMTSDPIMLNKLYAVLFDRIAQLHPIILEIVPEVFGRKRDIYFLGTRAIKVMEIEKLFQWFPHPDADTNFTTVMDSMWNSVYEFFTWSKGLDKTKLKDWRAFLN